ncbi:hypothetical protein [Streptomyces sp. 2P-4]|uniref:hypothetical protein n=1 Tax=Streptomyces sp. 2P-4 TaxID=2931974 RepID=UPI00254082F8|nr:hypothetical protein [Streptomyces sp. 2P-4]
MKHWKRRSSDRRSRSGWGHGGQLNLSPISQLRSDDVVDPGALLYPRRKTQAERSEQRTAGPIVGAAQTVLGQNLAAVGSVKFEALYGRGAHFEAVGFGSGRMAKRPVWLCVVPIGVGRDQAGSRT